MLSTLTALPIRLAILTPRIPTGIRWIARQPPEPLPQLNLRRMSPRWMDRSLCAAIPSTEADLMFFGIEHRGAPARLIAAVSQAREICNACPVTRECLTYALENDERYGVWGGTSGRQRNKLQTRIDAGASIAVIVAEELPDAP